MDKFEENIDLQNKNFKEMEKMILSAIKTINKKTLIRTDENNIPYGVSNANRGEQHILENGLSVYIFYNKEQPINYWISASPIFDEYKYTNRFGEHIGTKYNGKTAIEYTSGGINNGLPYNATSYYNKVQIGIIGDSSGKLMKLADTVPTMAEGYNLDVASFSSISPFNASNWQEANQYLKNGDLKSYIETYQPVQETSKKQISELQECLNQMEQIHIKQQQSSNKKGFLKKLLGRSNSLGEEINAFGERIK